MGKVFLLSGFNNWGKTKLIHALFKKKYFKSDTLYHYPEAENIGFYVQPNSNDDLSRDKYEEKMRIIINNLQKTGNELNHIFAAFCPTQEEKNNSTDIIKSLFPIDHVNILAIKYKWCCQSELIIPKIKYNYAKFTNVKIHILNEKGNINKKRQELVSLLKPLL